MNGKVFAVIVVGCLMGAAPAIAHHSFAAEYDGQKPVTITGVVTKIEWTNPHARFYLDVKDTTGTVSSFEFELGSPNSLMRRGWSRTSLKPGDTVTVEGFSAYRNPHVAAARSVVLSDGKKVFASEQEPQ